MYGLPKKVAVLLDFVHIREGGEGPAQIFCPLFTNCIYWVNLGMGREGETPAQIFWHIGIKKSGTSCPNWRGGQGNLDKIQKNSYFFRESVPKLCLVFFIYFRKIGFSYIFFYSFNCTSHDMFLSIRMIFLRPLGILIGNHLSFNLPSGHAIRFFRLSNIDASWPDIFNNRMSLLKRDRVVNGCLIAQRTCRHNHGLNRCNFFLWYTQLDI